MLKYLKIYVEQQRKKLELLMFISFLVAFLGGIDAVISTTQYNRINLQNTVDFKIEEKFNKKKDGVPFPNLNFKGKILTTGEDKEIKVSRGDFDKHQDGDIITIYKTTSGKFITQHEIDNQGIIHIFDKGFSFVFIPAFIFLVVGLFSLLAIAKFGDAREFWIE
jgi:hypothetical protein